MSHIYLNIHTYIINAGESVKCKEKCKEVRPVHRFLLVFRMCRSQLSGEKNSGDKLQEFLEISWAIFDVLFRSHIWNEAGQKAGGSGLGWDGTEYLHTHAHLLCYIDVHSFSLLLSCLT